MGKTIKQTAREVRREELRVYLSENNRVRQILDTVEKLEDPTVELDPLMIQRLRAATDTRMGLLKKYLPDVKQQEIEMTAQISSADDWAKDDDS